MIRSLAAVSLAVLLSACTTPSAPDRVEDTTAHVKVAPDGRGYLAMPDRVAWLQTDPRWAGHRLGHSSDTLGSDGCLVTAVAMAIGNLGITADPAQLNRRLTEANAFTPNGWLVWSGVEVATGGRARAVYHDDVSPSLIRSCMAQGQYPLVRFILPNGRSHWAMIVAESPEGYRMRDPLRDSDKPLIFPRGAEAFKSLRCVGPGDNKERA